MVDFAKQSPVLNTLSIVGKLVLIPNLYFVYITYNLIKSNPQTAIEEFVKLRNQIYPIYIVIFMVIGLLTFILQRQDKNSTILPNLKLFLPNVIISLILTTFSYAIAKFISDLLTVV